MRVTVAIRRATRPDVRPNLQGRAFEVVVVRQVEALLPAAQQEAKACTAGARGMRRRMAGRSPPHCLALQLTRCTAAHASLERVRRVGHRRPSARYSAYCTALAESAGGSSVQSRPADERGPFGPVVLDLQRLGVDRLQPSQLRHARLDGREDARPPILLLLHARPCDRAALRSRGALQRMRARSGRAEPRRANRSAEARGGARLGTQRPMCRGQRSAAGDQAGQYSTTLQRAVLYCLCGTGPSASQSVERLCLQEDRQRSARLGVDGAVVRRRVRDTERLLLQLRQPLLLLGLPAHPAVQRESRRHTTVPDGMQRTRPLSSPPPGACPRTDRRT